MGANCRRTESNLSDRVSIVIPSLNEHPETLNSIPNFVTDIAVVSDGNRAEARNLGVKQTKNPIIVFCDDDIIFNEKFFKKQIDLTPRGTISGLRDFTFDLLLTRFLIIHRDDFNYIGGFNEKMNHGEDTEFSLNALSSGFELRLISRDGVTHISHQSEGQGIIPSLWSKIYMCREYPNYAPYILNKMLKRTIEIGPVEAIKRASNFHNSNDE